MKRDSDKHHKSKIQEILVITEITSTYKDHERTNNLRRILKGVCNIKMHR